MGLAEIQKALARLSIDRTLRERFFVDALAAGTELGLDAEDCQNLARIPGNQVQRFAESLRDKRHSQIRRAIPIAARAIGRQFDELCERYTRESAPRGSKADLDDPAGFVRAISGWRDRVDPVWAVDLARYELAWRQATRAGLSPLVRIFDFPVARLALGRGTDVVASRATLVVWWRPTRRGRVRHLVISMPSIRHRHH